MTDPRAAAVAAELDRRGLPLARLVVTDNRVSLLSVRKRARGYEVRVAQRLLALGDRVVGPVADFVGGKRRPLRALVAELPEAPPAAPRRVVIRTRGRYHDLAPMAEQEAARALAGEPPIPVGWGVRRRIKRGQRTVRLGSYQHRNGIARIHPILDHPRVPAWFIGFIVYHELLHHRLRDRVAVTGGRRRLHGAEFEALEAEHPRFADAQRWEAEQLPRLLAGRL